MGGGVLRQKQPANAFFPLSLLSLLASCSCCILMCGLLCRRQSENACKNWLTNRDIDCLFVWVEDVAGSGGMQSNDCKFSVCGPVRVHAIIPVTVLITRV